MSQDELYLRHVLDAVETIQHYVAVGHDQFMAASHWQDAVIRPPPGNSRCTGGIILRASPARPP